MAKRSPLALAVLALLSEAPMHPYRMQQLLTLRGKDQVVNVSQRASLYATIDRLTRDGLVEVRETIREGHRPERSVYQITDAGRSAAHGWMVEMLSSPRPDFPEFHAALSHLPLLEPAEATELLRRRHRHLAAAIEGMRGQLAAERDTLPRLLLLDNELILAVHETELRWLDTVLADLGSGAMTWTPETLADLSRKFDPPAT
ncbi:PadR family transcriptional regulator [Specibacter cremeus]|uniref:PadR family transcriptional regulator n=1 Tax=Specibacter cremeus TaxID=1629051 RepID=UPI000F7B68B2|nr:PadR family transcriptional regulator [Specibacter cremeus]